MKITNAPTKGAVDFKKLERNRQSMLEFSHLGTVLRKSVGYNKERAQKGSLSCFIAIGIEVRHDVPNNG